MVADSVRKTNVLVVEDEADLREIIAFFIHSQFNVNVIEAENGMKAKEILDSNPNIQIIVSDYNMPDWNGGKLFQHLKSIQYPAKFVLVSAINPNEAPEFKELSPDAFAEKPAFSDLLKRFISQYLSESSNGETADHAYIGLTTTLLLSMERVSCDLYARLSQTKFVKVVNQGDSFGADEYSRFSEKGIEVLFVEKSKAMSLFEGLRDAYLKKLARKALPLEDQFRISNEIVTSVRSMATHFGFSPELEQMTKVGVDLALRIIAKTPELKKLLESVDFGKESYLTVHSTRITYLANYIAKLMDWDSENTALKMAFASLLHDSTLQKQFEHHQVSELSLDLSKLNLSPTDLDDFIRHPIRASQIIEEFKGLPPDVDVIIAQHHEKPDGSGFPNGINHTRISPLASVFIVAHDLLDFYELRKSDFKLEEFISSFQDVYSAGVFKKILNKLHLIHFN